MEKKGEGWISQRFLGRGELGLTPGRWVEGRKAEGNGRVELSTSETWFALVWVESF